MLAVIFWMFLLSLLRHSIESTIVQELSDPAKISVDANESIKKGATWALLVAGSKGYDNYRHQADVCHAYQILLANNIPQENIIVMLYDDIAYNEKNPTPGVIVNRPNGTNVYAGVKMDYVGARVTPQNFLNVLKGDADAMRGIGTGRVIKSGPNDHVFVFFSDHGGGGFLAFPNELLTAADLISALNYTAAKKQFRKMVIYVEACFAGSMFDELLAEHMKIFVMTASDPFESSYACYWDKLRETYLGDLFSVMWMHEAEKEDLIKASLNHMYQQVRRNTDSSHVENYGHLDIGNTKIWHFLGHRDVEYRSPNVPINPYHDVVPSEDVPFITLQKKHKEAQGKDKNDLSKEITSAMKRRKHVDQIFEKILLRLASKEFTKIKELKRDRPKINKANMHCHSAVIKSFSKTCISIPENPYAIRFLEMFVNACSADWLNTSTILQTIKSSCSNVERIVGAI